ncbi:hypothetical protein K8O92_27925 [Nocardia asteroides]|nr:hypothetical protein K8O92_27925 [Nocardia asteroides]
MITITSTKTRKVVASVAVALAAFGTLGFSASANSTTHHQPVGNYSGGLYAGCC